MTKLCFDILQCIFLWLLISLRDKGRSWRGEIDTLLVKKMLNFSVLTLDIIIELRLFFFKRIIKKSVLLSLRQSETRGLRC